MRPVYVELSPGSAVKQRTEGSETRCSGDADRLQRASRDAYYYNSDYSGRGDDGGPDLSSSVMMACELDAILRGGADSNGSRSRHASAVRASPHQWRSSSAEGAGKGGIAAVCHPTSFSTSSCAGGRVDATAPPHELHPSRQDAAAREPQRASSGAVAAVVRAPLQPPPPLAHLPPHSRPRGYDSGLSHHASRRDYPTAVDAHASATVVSASGNARRSAMQQSIDRFFEDSEAREGGTPTLELSSAASSRASRSPLSAASPSPRPPSNKRSAGSAVRAGTPLSPNDLSRELFARPEQAAQRTVAAPYCPTRARAPLPAQREEAAAADRGPTVLQERPVNCDAPKRRLGSKEACIPESARAISSDVSVSHCKDAGNEARSPSFLSTTPAHMMTAEVSLRCEACRYEVSMLVVYAAGAAGVAKFCPLCGSGAVHAKRAYQEASTAV